MTLLGWYAAIAVLMFALALDEHGPEAAALIAFVWPLLALGYALVIVLVIVLAVSDHALVAWQRRSRS